MKIPAAWLVLLEGKLKQIYVWNICRLFTSLFFYSDPPELMLGMEGAPPKHRYSGGGRQSRADVVEQWARQSSGHAQRLSSSTSIHRRGSEGNYLPVSMPSLLEHSVAEPTKHIFLLNDLM